MAILINNLDKLIDQFEEVVGRTPIINSYRNRPIRVEIANISFAGLAAHGTYGMICQAVFLRSFYDSCIAYLRNNTQLPKFEHIFTYEFARNYLFPDQIEPLFDYRTYQLEDRNNPNKTLIEAWVWVKQGFVNVLGGLLRPYIIPSVNYNFHGHDAEGYWRIKENYLDTYIAGANSGIYTWDNTFMYYKLIWTSDSNNPYGSVSIDDLYAGILVRLWKMYGGKTFLIGFFRAISMMANRHAVSYLNSPNKLSYIDSLSTNTSNAKLNVLTVIENLYIASTRGARLDLYNYFTGTLKVPIRQEARTYAINLMNNV